MLRIIKKHPLLSAVCLVVALINLGTIAYASLGIANQAYIALTPTTTIKSSEGKTEPEPSSNPTTPTQQQATPTQQPTQPTNQQTTTTSRQPSATQLENERLAKCITVNNQYAQPYVNYRASLPYPSPNLPEADFISATNDRNSKLRVAYSQYVSAVNAQGCVANLVGAP